MGNSFGRTILDTVGGSIGTSADGRPEMKIGGVTVDWTTVVPVSGTDVLLEDGIDVAVGEQYLRYGQVLTAITNPATDVVTINGGPSGGTFTITVTTSAGAQTTAGIAYNATAATVQTAVQGLSNVGAGNATVTGSAGGPFTIVFNNSLGATSVTASGASLTGGTSPTATVASSAPGGDVNWYGPFDPNATDGRATLTPGQTFFCLRTIKSTDLNSNHPQACFGGLHYKSRILATASGHSLAAGPTFTELLAVLPRLQLVVES